MEDLVRRFLVALSGNDQGAVDQLVHPEVEIRTERTTHRGRDEALEWTGKSFDHLDRRYVPIEIEPTPTGVRVKAELQYVWRESGEVGNSSSVVIELGIRDGTISSWDLSDAPDDTPEGD